MNTSAVVISSDARWPIARPNRPAMGQPISGRRTIAVYMTGASAFHEIDVLNRDGAAVAEITDENGKADGGFGRSHGENEQREHLTGEIAEECRKRDQVDVDGKQDQFDRHQDDDDVLAIDEDAEHTDGEQDRRDDEVISDADAPGLHRHAPCPGLMSTISIASAGRRATWRATDCRRTPGRERSVSTMAPIMATSRISPAVWK